MIAAGVIGGLYILCAFILVLGVKERRGEAAQGLECSGFVEMLLSPQRGGQVELSSGLVLQDARAPLGFVR